MSLPDLKLKANARARVLKGHPWVFANEVESLLPDGHNGRAVAMRDKKGRFLGSGIYNNRSRILWRRFSLEQLELNEEWLGRTLMAAVKRRPPHKARRLVWSESDNLPGLVVDRFDTVLVIQALTMAMDLWLPWIGRFLRERLRPETVVFRCDSPVRLKEGLETHVTTDSGEQAQPFRFEVDGMRYWIDPGQGQKTGFYLDQRPQYPRVARHSAGRRVLDCFCNQGGFALHAAKAGALAVSAIDSSAAALETARRNAEENGLDISLEESNVFDFLRKDERIWDLIVLDPPPFAKSHADLEAAFRGYKEIHLRAMKRLSPGGLLATYTCSHHVGHDLLLRIAGEAAADVRREARVLEFHHQPSDHPVLPVMPESEYLRGLLLQIG